MENRRFHNIYEGDKPSKFIKEAFETSESISKQELRQYTNQFWRCIEDKVKNGDPNELVSVVIDAMNDRQANFMRLY